MDADASTPKTTRPPASSRRATGDSNPVGLIGGRKLDAMPDRIDVRDWPYQPSLRALPDQVVNCDLVPMILDQGQEGACTGFALAAVVNYLIALRQAERSEDPRLPVSPRMMYEMARRYDEWPGESYEGSSARGAMQGWIRHGVCRLASWPHALTGPDHLSPDIAKEARGAPGGAFYRVMHREIRDMHAAIAEVGILYITIMVHDGWFEPGPKTQRIGYTHQGRRRSRNLPLIQRSGRAENGHAVAIVGYDAVGFIVQNSWGEGWGDKGFALLPYEDFLMHATDVWAAQLGVPLALDLWEAGYSGKTTGLARAAPAIPLAEIRPYVVDVANNGELSLTGDYWTTQADLARLFSEIIPKAALGWKRRRVMLYLHGGLNSEQATAQRVVAFRDVMLENEIYPLHIMWESGAVETIRNIIADVFSKADDRAGNAIADWMQRLRDGLIEAKDRSLELTAAGPGSALWAEMKENARLSSEHRAGLGAMQLMAKHVEAAMQATSKAEQAKWELHVVAHSAGSIYAAHALPHLLGCGIPLKSLHFMAPAMTIELFRQTMMPAIETGACPTPDMYVLSDVGERDDDVGPYGKSLLYLVSNAFEPVRGTPLLGLEKFIRPESPANQTQVDPAIAGIFKTSLVVAGEAEHDGLGPSRSDSHGGFDNDPATLNSILHRILGAAPARPFVARDLQF